VSTFIVIAALMVVVALAWVLLPLLRSSAGGTVERRAANVSIYRDQFADLDADLKRGTISPQQHAEAKAELERRMLDDAQVELTPAATSQSTSYRTALAVLLAIPVLAGLLYAWLGSPDAFSPLATKPEDTHQLSGEQVNEMIVKLQHRLEREPDNAEGWVILARTYYTMRKFPEATAAYEKLIALIPNDADLLADYADALAMNQGRRIAGKPLELVNRALKIDPTQWKALAMAGTEAFERKDYAGAVDYWTKLQRSAPQDAPIAKQIQASIDEARQLAGLPPAAVASASPAAPPRVAAPPAAAPAAPSARTTGPSVAAEGKSVSGTVTLASGLAAKASPTDAVFVFARPGDGSKMPIAIVRAQVKDLPLKFTLDDARSMSPAKKISGFDEVIVAARISRSGNAMPASGDLEGVSKPVKVGANGLAITIDRVIP
jgi:cytochrome c-type biogenesis protein CcmH